MFIFGILFLTPSYSQVSLYVGDRTFLAAPSPPSNCALSQTAWASRHSSVDVRKDGYGAEVRVTSYFEGIAQVQCDYYYYWYDNRGYMHTNHSTKYYNITCLPVNINLRTTSLNINVGGGAQIDYSLSPSISPTPTVRFYSSNTNVATVNSNGYVFGEGAGNAVITVSSDAGPSKTVYVSVVSVDPTSLSIPSSLTAYVGESSNMPVTLYPSNAQTSLSWYSSNNSVAYVNSSNRIVGVGEGTATIYAETSNGIKSNNCNVKVEYRKPTKVSLSNSKLVIPVGTEKNLVATVTPSNAKYTLTWISSNDGVAMVNNTGQVIALKAGTAKITVRTDNGCSATCDIEVPPLPSSVTIPSKIQMLCNGNRKLNARFVPSNAQSKVSWSSSNKEVATVDDTGNVIAIGPGVADITVTTSNNKKATCRVEVKTLNYNFYVWTFSGEKISFPLDSHPAVTCTGENIVVTTSKTIVEYPENQVRKFTMEDNTVEELPTRISLPSSLVLDYGEETTLDYRLYPTDYDIETSLTWKSDNPNVVRVDNNGKISACGVGKANVTVTARNGCKASCSIEVLPPTYYLLLWLRDGGRMSYPFNERPVITHKDAQVSISSHKGSVTYSHANVWKFTLSDKEMPNIDTSVDRIVNSEANGFIGNDVITFSFCNPGDAVRIYNTSGVLINTYYIDENGYLQIPLSYFKAGIYILKTRSITYKFVKK